MNFARRVQIKGMSFLLAIAAVASVASQTNAQFKFDVVSIRRQAPGTQIGAGFNVDPTPDGFRASLTTWQMIMVAYSPGGYASWGRVPVSNLPGWQGEWYVIDARVAPEDVERWRKHGSDHELLRSAMKAVLKDRFKLVVEQKPIQIPAYDLVVAKRGPRLKPAVPGAVLPKGMALTSGGVAVGERLPNNGSRWRYYDATIGDLVEFLQKSAQLRPVQDRTGLTGRYDFTLQLVDQASREGEEPVRNWPVDHLGLALKSGMMPGIALKIDHIERPSPN